jgi:hypothetical protein
MLNWLPDYHWLFDRIADQHWLVDHIPEWLIALFTFTLWRSTRKLWITTRDTLRHTERTTEILQRAYVRVLTRVDHSRMSISRMWAIRLHPILNGLSKS